MQCGDRLDWVAKRFLLGTFQEAEQLEWSDPWLQSIDLEYHNVSLDEGLYYELVRQGQMRRIVSEEEIKNAIFQPPTTTRAFFRGRSVAKFNCEIASIQWNELTFHHNGTIYSVSLERPSHDVGLDRVNAAIRHARTFSELMERLG